MSNSENWSMCQVVCWAISALVGLLIFLGTAGAVGFVAAVMAGAAMAVFGGLVLTRLFCAEGGRPQAKTSSVGTSRAAVETKVANSVSSARDTAETAAKAAEQVSDVTGEEETENAGEGTRPETLKGPRDGKADDLKQIKGIGPKLEQLLNEMGFYHFDQIAGWGTDEVAWVNENLKGFKGRVTRDNWVEQATTLAAGGETDFSKRVEDGDVY